MSTARGAMALVYIYMYIIYIYMRADISTYMHDNNNTTVCKVNTINLVSIIEPSSHSTR